ncbi:MAG TPA: amidase [Candidatus Limnocylindria bacterium]|nr:amidase [Candidatus Limnocylindria bacterium]
MKITRRDFCQLTTLGAAALASPGCSTATSDHPAPVSADGLHPFALEDATISGLQQRLASGQLTAVSLTQQYLARIAELDRRGPILRSVIELNPDALAIAAALDQERQVKGSRGPLHGIPILIKDNIATHDRMTTTAGSLAMVGCRAPRDAFLVERLRAAGAVILGKANLSEWAGLMGDPHTTGFSGRGGQARNPYVLDRNTSGSSAGSAVAVAANLCAVAVGTETNGSILSPSRFNGIVGLKPTVGLVSRAGIVPISRTQDTAGPMARTVTDAAILLGALAGKDPHDSATAASIGRAQRDYTKFLDADGLRGARIGVARATFNGHPGVAPLMDSLVATLKARDAMLIDPVELPPDSTYDAAEWEVLMYEFKAGLNEYLAALGPAAPVHTLREVIEFNARHQPPETPWMNQTNLRLAETKGPLTDQAYLDALAKCRRLTRNEGLDVLMDRHQLDAIFTSGGGPAGVVDYVNGDRDTGGGGISLAAVAGYPSISVPAGFILGLPVSVFFLGRAWSEPMLLRVAYAFEQATQARRPPQFRATVAVAP